MRNWLRYAGTTRGRSQWHDQLESLEPRVLLTGQQIVSDAMTWRGIPMEVRENSWVLTFDHALGRDAAMLRAQTVASSMGLVADRIEVTARGRFANIQTRSGVTEASAAAAKSRFSFLRQFEPDHLSYPDLVPNDARYPEQWALNNTGQAEIDSGTGQLVPGVPGADMDAERAWNISTGSDRVVIAVIDTGVDIRHPDLAANIFTNPNEIPNNNIDDDGNGFVDDVNGWDFVGNGQAGPDNDPADPEDPGHGTSVSGCIGAVGGNGIGIAGTAWNVSILPLKIGADAPGGLPLFAILGAVDYCTMMRTQYGINIVATNNSYGALRPADFDDLDSAQEIAIQDSTDAGILFVASAGNDAVDNDSAARAFPASYPNPDIIAVAATTNRDTLASFSNYGRTSVDVGAPGEQVLTTAVGGGYRLIDGTSFSGPYTAGVVAMIASVNRFLTKEQIKAVVLNSVDPLPQLQGLVLTNGRVNLFKALQNAQFPGPIVAAITPGTQTSPVSEIRVSFSKDIDPAFYNISGVSLRRANGDMRFDGNDVFIDLTDPNVATVTLTARQLRIALTAPLSRDQHRLVLRATNFRDTDGLFLNGGTGTGNDEIYDFNVVAFRGLYEPNDAISQATPVILDTQGRATLSEITIGDGVYEVTDVDIFRVFASGPALITGEITARGLPVPSGLDSYLRLFDASGVELARNDNFSGLDSKVQFFVPSAGQYYIGVSAFPNSRYNPILENTGTGSSSTGNYSLFVQVQGSSSDSSTKNNSTAQLIPSTGTITSTLFFTDGRSILDVNVRVNIEHTFVGDLLVTLTGPSGQIVTLVNRRGGAGDNFTNTTFDDQASNLIVSGAPPYTGSFRPESPLTTYNQTSAAGTWTLTITDQKAGDSGRLVSWGLDLVLANDVFGPFEVNDTDIVSTATNINTAGAATFDAVIGDGAFGLRDVDLFRFTAGTGTTISAVARPTGGSLDTILRLFDSAGNELAADKRRGSTSSTITYVVGNAGVYYIGVSGGNTTTETEVGNDNYQLGVGGSGNVTDATGAYSLQLTVSGGVSEGALPLIGNTLSVGLNGNGAIGLTSPPAGQNPLGLRLGNTEFLLRNAGIQSYFGASVDGFAVRNTGDGTQTDIPASLANESDYSNRRAAVTGVYRNLGIRRVLSFGVGDRAIAIDVTLTNRSLDVINNLAWLEGFNPEQGQTGVPGSGNTLNNIRQTAPRLGTAVVANSLTFGLGAPSGGAYPAVISFEPRDTVRDPFNVINSPNDPDPTGDAGASSDLDLALAFNLGSLAGGESKTFRYFIFLDNSLQGVLNAYSAMNNNLGGGHLTRDPKTPVNDGEGFADLPYRVYYPEGFANSRANTFLPIVNGNAEKIRVVIIARYEKQVINGVETFYAPDMLYDSLADATNGEFKANRRGGLQISKPDLYAAGTVDRVMSEVVTQATGARRNGVRKDVPYALEVRASAPVGAILSHYDFGIATGDSFTSEQSATWLLGAGSKGAGINDFVTFYNPTANAVKVTLTAFPEAATTGDAITVIRTVLANRRGGFSIKDIPEIPNGNVSFRLDADFPIVAALTHYDTNTASGFGTLAQPGAGSLSGSTGEGEFGVGSGSEAISIVNPGTSPANVTFTFAFANGSSYRHTATVAASRRGGFNVANLVSFPVGQSYAVSYTSNTPVGVNIASASTGEMTGSVLSTKASTQWLFAEGFRPVGAPGATSAVAEFLRLYNPSAAPTTIEIVMNYNNGESEVFRRSLPSRSGININIHDLVTGTKATVGTVAGVGSYYGVKVQSSLPIVAFAGHFDTFLGGGFGTLGTSLGTTGAAT